MEDRVLKCMENNLQEQFKLVVQHTTQNFSEKYLKSCDSVLKLLRAKLHSAQFSGTKKNFDTRIRRLKCNKAVIKNKIFVGRGLKQRRRKTKTYVWEDAASAFDNRIQTGLITNLEHIDVKHFFDDVKSTICVRLRNVQRQYDCVKIYLVLSGEFTTKDNVDIKYFHTPTKQILHATDLDEWYEKYVVKNILHQLEEFQERDSGWAITDIINITVNINKCEPIRGFGFIDLPSKIKNKKAIINIETDDDACFAWAIVSALYPAQSHVSSRRSYPHYKTVLDVTNITFPMTLNQIKKFESQNNISINVYTTDDKDFKVAPIYLTDNVMTKHINLLMISEADYSHFCWIKNLSRLVSSQIAVHHKMYLCDRCLAYFYSEEKLKQHTLDCCEINACAVKLPTADEKWLKFKNFSRKELVPFVVYADFECVLETVTDINLGKQTNAYQRHTAYSVGYYVHCAYDQSLSRYEHYRGASCAEWFANDLKNLSYKVNSLYDDPVSMTTMTKAETEKYTRDQTCHMCGECIEETDVKVRDHCHLTGKYRGPAHSKCNLKYYSSHVIPVIFHNLTSYDAHFIIEEIATQFKGRVSVIPLNKEKYISFTKRVGGTRMQLRFVDSFRFMSSSLSNLVEYLGEKNLIVTRSAFSDVDDEKFSLLARKGVFPYDYVVDDSKLLETSLPEPKHFYNQLTDSDISEEDYLHAVNVWNRFNIHTLGEYSDLYLKSDVMLLADVFENFRGSCLQNYNLDPTHYYTIPGLAWDAMLKLTRIKLELLTDIDMVMFIERGIRGGVSQCCNRYGKANNRYMKDYDNTVDETYLMYFDVNNLYGWAMSKYLPYKNFRWVANFEDFQLQRISEDSSIGYVLEVDLEYPKEIHDLHKDLPFCASSEKPVGSQHTKLMTTFNKKERYVGHYLILQQALNHGVKIVKIHKILQFNQSAWLKPYIDFNTSLRVRAENDFEKNLFKLMNNSVFGKTMENVRKRVDIKLVTKWYGRCGANSLISKTNFHRRTIFNPNFIAIEMQKQKVVIDKPIYVGMCILDISKTCLYDFHYDYMLTKFQNNCKLLYTDTDSLLYHIKCDDIYYEMKQDIDRFDTSGYAIKNRYNMPLANKKVPGLMKDESNGEIMLEFVGLRSKMYSFRMSDTEVKKAKGVKNSVVKKTITFKNYLHCLNNNDTTYREQRSIQSRLHKVYSICQSKIALNGHDDKRSILPNSTDTLPWGHYGVSENYLD